MKCGTLWAAGRRICELTWMTRVKVHVQDTTLRQRSVVSVMLP